MISRAMRTISDFTLPASTRHELAAHAELRSECYQALFGPIQQLILDLDRRHECFAHGLHRHVLDHMQQVDLRPDRGGQCLRPPADENAVFASGRLRGGHGDSPS